MNKLFFGFGIVLALAANVAIYVGVAVAIYLVGHHFKVW